MLEGKRSSLLIFLLLLATTAAGQNISVSTTVLTTTSAGITDFSVATGNVVDFLFTVQNLGNTNISVFPEITVYDNNNNTVVQLIYNSAVNISAGSLKDLTLSWNTGSTGEFNATLAVYYDNNSKSVTASKTFTLVPGNAQRSAEGGGSGAGVVSREPYSNVLLWEMRERYLQEELPSSYEFTTPELSVYEVSVTPTKTYGTTSVKVELLKGLSKIEGVTAPPGKTIKHISIWFGSEEFSKQDWDAIIRFMVDLNWLAENNIDASSIRLLKWDGDKWISLITELKSRSEKYLYYEAKTSAIGAFAISSVANFSEDTPVIQITDTPSSIDDQTVSDLPKFHLWVYVTTALILIAIFFYFLISRRQE